MKKLSFSPKKLLYTLCFLFLCLIDQRKGSVTGNMQHFWSNCTGISIALLIISHYKFKDFMKIPYAIWSGFCIAAIPCSTLILRHLSIDSVQWYSALANIAIYGFLVIRTIIAYKSKPLQWKNLLFPLFMCVMFLLMGLSVNDSVWPWYFLMVFGTFAFTNFSNNERKQLSFALVDGILLGFFCIQGLAFVFRPYDQIRYLGMYANPNINALFYSIVYCVFLSKLVYFMFEYNQAYKRILVLLTFFFCGGMWSFCILTGCRTALVSMAISTCIAGLYCMRNFKQRILTKSLGMIAGLLLCILSSFPIVFGCVRYLPAAFHHPIWFYAEYSENKVHSWDPIDSAKYIDLDEVLDYSFGRLFKDKYYTPNDPASIGYNFSATNLYCSTAPTLGLTKENPLVPQTRGSISLRKHIYSYYFSQLQLSGHTNSENGVYVTPEHYAPHAHNLFLQITFNFGILIGVFFIAFCSKSILKSICNTFKYKNVCSLSVLLLLANIYSFGLFEMMWTNGYLAFTLIFCLPFVDNKSAKKL